jgi:ribosomal protein S12 methylthiotransferase accessory factor
MKESYSPRLTEVYNRIVDSRLGIIRNVNDLNIRPDEPKIYITVADCTLPKYWKTLNPTRTGEYFIPANGAGLDHETSLWSAIGEACERYAASIVFEDQLIHARYSEVRDQAIDLEKIIRFSPEQYAQPGFPFAPLRPDSFFRWTEGFNHSTGQDVLVPAQIVWLGYDYLQADELITPKISTGLACGSSYWQALHSGLCEVIERDAFMLTWQMRRQVPRLQLLAPEACFSPRFLDLLDHPYVDVNIRLLTTEFGIPSVLCVLKPLQADIVAVGMSTHSNMSKAIEKAVIEAHHTRNWTLDMLQEGVPTFQESDLTDFKQHVQFYLNEANFSRLSHLYNETSVIQDCSKLTAEREPDYQRACLQLIERLDQYGYEVVAVDITTADIASLGLCILKVIVPGLQPLNADHRYRHLDKRRMEIFARNSGEILGAINQDPHPFP